MDDFDFLSEAESVFVPHQPKKKPAAKKTEATDLTKAMEISKPTPYAAFGDKEGPLREVLRMYLGLRAEEYTAALNRSTVKEVAGAWLRMTGGVRKEAI